MSDIDGKTARQHPNRAPDGPTTEELLAEHTAAGKPDPTPEPVQPGDPEWVEPYAEATPVAPSGPDEDVA